MSKRLDPHAQHNPVGPDSGHGGDAGGHRRHGWMMIACCVPMLVIAIVLVVTGVASPAFLIVALGCTAMMAMMTGGMNHGGDNSGDDHRG